MKYICCNFSEENLLSTLKHQIPLGWEDCTEESNKLITMLGKFHEKDSVWFVKCENIQDNPKLMKLYEKD